MKYLRNVLLAATFLALSLPCTSPNMPAGGCMVYGWHLPCGWSFAVDRWSGGSEESFVPCCKTLNFGQNYNLWALTGKTEAFTPTLITMWQPLNSGIQAGNSFTAELLDRLTNEINTLSDNVEVTVIVLKSEGKKAFCGGASFDELITIQDREEGKIFFSGFANVINAMRNCRKVIIGRVQGETVGGGVGLAAACDYVFASINASVRLSELSIGIAPLVIAPAVERKIGKAAMAEMSLYPTEWKTHTGHRKRVCSPRSLTRQRKWTGNWIIFPLNYRVTIPRPCINGKKCFGKIRKTGVDCSSIGPL